MISIYVDIFNLLAVTYIHIQKTQGSVSLECDDEEEYTVESKNPKPFSFFQVDPPKSNVYSSFSSVFGVYQLQRDIGIVTLCSSAKWGITTAIVILTIRAEQIKPCAPSGSSPVFA